MDDIRAFLSRKPLLFDGGMGTYYKAAPGVDCEQANLTDRHQDEHLQPAPAGGGSCPRLGEAGGCGLEAGRRGGGGDRRGGLCGPRPGPGY